MTDEGWSFPSRAELRELGARLGAAWDPRAARVDPHPDVQAREQVVVDLAVGWARCSALIGDASAFPQLLRFLDEGSDDLEAMGAFAEAAATLARDDAALRRQLHGEATSGYGVVRSPILDVLDPDDPVERALLEQALVDAHPSVATTARRQLAAAGPLPTWTGHFARDPLAGLSDEEAATARPTVDRYVALREVTHPTPDQDAERRELLGRLPLEAAVSAAEIVLRAEGLVRDEDRAAVVRALVPHRGGFDRLLALTLGRSVGWSPQGALAAEAHRLPAGERDRLARELLDALDPATLPTGALLSRLGCVEAIWPPDLDPRPMFDLRLAWARLDGAPRYGLGALDRALAWGAPDEAWTREALVASLRAGDDDPAHALVAFPLQQLARTWPVAEQVALALRALDEGWPSTGWAARVLVEHARPELLARWGRPEVRRHAFHDLRGALLVRAREELAAGRLTEPWEVYLTMDRLGSVAGGLADRLAWIDPAHRTEADDAGLPPERGASRGMEAFWAGYADEVVADAGPAACAPPTDAEWAALRRVRDAAADEAADLFCGLLPAGPWHPDDLAYFERVVDLPEPEEGWKGSSRIEHLCGVAISKRSKAAVPALQRLAARDDDPRSLPAVAWRWLALGEAPPDPGAGVGPGDEDGVEDDAW